MTKYKLTKHEAEQYVLKKYADKFAAAKEAVKKQRELMRWRNKHACMFPSEELKAEAYAKKDEFNKQRNIVREWNSFFAIETRKRMVEIWV